MRLTDPLYTAEELDPILKDYQAKVGQADQVIIRTQMRHFLTAFHSALQQQHEIKQWIHLLYDVGERFTGSLALTYRVKTKSQVDKSRRRVRSKVDPTLMAIMYADFWHESRPDQWNESHVARLIDVTRMANYWASNAHTAMILGEAFLSWDQPNKAATWARGAYNSIYKAKAWRSNWFQLIRITRVLMTALREEGNISEALKFELQHQRLIQRHGTAYENRKFETDSNRTVSE